MISIIIPIYNQSEHLSKLLDSIILQSYDNYEIIIIDDGSIDDIKTVIVKYREIFKSKITYFNQENRGAGAARNRGAKMAKGEYIIFCDADIIMAPKMLELMLEALKKNHEASFCYSAFLWGKRKFALWPYDLKKLKTMPYINTASIIRKKHFPGFDEKLKRFQDWDLWLTMAESNHGGVWLDQILYKVNIGGAQSMSHWLPAFAYKLLPFLPAVKKYNQAKEIIMKKHGLLPP